MRRKIVNVDYGIASAYSDGVIEINRKLKGNLRRKILAHERRHTLGSYSKVDYENDFKSKNPYFFESLKFAWKNPEALINFFFLMISYYRNTLTWNSTAFYPFFYLGCIFMLFFYLTIGINPLLGFLGWICVYTLINIYLLVLTHLYVRKQGI